MKPVKEKARELVEKFRQHTYDAGNNDDSFAKECALIAVEEVLNTYISCSVQRNYLEDLKTEIVNYGN